MQVAEYVIIGGGIVGVSIAYQLALRGASNIVLLEKDTIASGSSGRATGGIRQQFADELDILFSREGVRFYEHFTHEQDTPTEKPAFLQHGYLFLVNQSESWQAMQQHAALQQSLGVPTQLLTPTEVQQLVPQLNVADLLGGTFCPTDGYSDTASMTQAIASEAQRLGAAIRQNILVTGISVERGRIQAVHTQEETFSTQVVVNAAGVYAPHIAQLAGITDLPVYPLRRQLYLTTPFAALPGNVPMTVDLSTGFHFRRRGERVVMTVPMPIHAATTAYDTQLDESFLSTVQAEAQRRCPPLAEATIQRAWAGLYEMTPDEHPILGKTEIEGFLCACGFSGHGFMHTPMAAKLMTELLLDGFSSTLPIEQFSLNRFRTGKLIQTTHLL